MSQWKEISHIDEIPASGARVIMLGETRIAVFKNNQNEVFALKDECPHRKGYLSQGIVHHRTVTCPLHNWKIDLSSGEAIAPDEGCTGHYPVKIEQDKIFIQC